MRDTIIITDAEVDDQPVYVISVAARLCELHPQTLRSYERLGLVCPHRSDNRNRLYSPRDIERLRRIQRLTRELGVNLAGVEVILELLDRIDQYQKEIEELRELLSKTPSEGDDRGLPQQGTG